MGNSRRRVERVEQAVNALPGEVNERVVGHVDTSPERLWEVLYILVESDALPPAIAAILGPELVAELEAEVHGQAATN